MNIKMSVHIYLLESLTDQQVVFLDVQLDQEDFSIAKYSNQ